MPAAVTMIAMLNGFTELGTFLPGRSLIVNRDQVGHRELVDGVFDKGNAPVEQRDVNPTWMETAGRCGEPRCLGELLTPHPVELGLCGLWAHVEDIAIPTIVVGWLRQPHAGW